MNATYLNAALVGAPFRARPAIVGIQNRARKGAPTGMLCGMARGCRGPWSAPAAAGGVSRQARQGRNEPCCFLKHPLRALRALRETFCHAVRCSGTVRQERGCNAAAGGVSRQARQGRNEPCCFLKHPLRALRALREIFRHSVMYDAYDFLIFEREGGSRAAAIKVN
jgi:hypothetical protein